MLEARVYAIFAVGEGGEVMELTCHGREMTWQRDQDQLRDQW